MKQPTRSRRPAPGRVPAAAALTALTAFGALATALAAPAQAATICNFNIECYMTQPCEGSGWELVLDAEAGAMSTVFGDLDIIHASDDATQFAATGDGALYLLTIGARMSFLTAHIRGEPETITYVGECDAE